MSGSGRRVVGAPLRPARAAAVVLALVAGGAMLTDATQGSQGPVGNPTPTAPAPTQPTPEISTPPELDLPKGQVLITADLEAEDIQRWDQGITHSTEGDLGATELSRTVASRTLYFSLEGFCRGDQDTWWVLTSSYGGGGFGRCGVDVPLSAPAPLDVSAADPFSPDNWTRDRWAGWDSLQDQDTVGSEKFWEPSAHMFLTAKVPQAVRDCVAGADIEVDACFDPAFDDSLAEGLEILDSTDATFGFTLYQELAPHVATVLGQGFEALTVVDGTEYLFSHAIQAPDADTLTVDLDVSDRARLVGVRQKGGRELELRVDGRPPSDREAPPLLARIPALTATTLVPPGAHTLSVEMVGGKPQRVGLAVVVYEAAS